MFKLKNPIPSSVIDTGKIHSFFQHYFKLKRLIMPYYGDSDHTSHWMLILLHNLCLKSATYKACERDINSFAFGSGLRLVQAIEPGLESMIEIDSSPELGNKYIQAVKDLGINFVDFSTLTRKLESYRKQSGNAYLKIRVFFEDNIYKVFFDVIHYKRAALMATKPTEDKMMIVVKEWDIETLRKKENQPQFYFVSEVGQPFIWSESEGLFETVVHLKTCGNDESDWYGRPDILSVLEYLFIEQALADHGCKVNSTETTTKDIFAFKAEPVGIDLQGDDDQQDNFKAFMKTLRQISTTEGYEPSSIAGIEYLEEAPTHYQLGINRDTNWSKHQIETATTKIATILGWSPELLGSLQTQSGIGSDKIINLFITKNTSTIEPIQREYEDLWLWTMREIGNITGKEILGKVQFRFPNKIERLVESLRRTKDAQNIVNTEGDS